MSSKEKWTVYKLRVDRRRNPFYLELQYDSGYVTMAHQNYNAWQESVNEAHFSQKTPRLTVLVPSLPQSTAPYSQ